MRDLLHVDDLADGFIKAYENIDRTAGKVFNIGGGAANALSVIEAVRMIEKETGCTANLAYDEWRPGDQRYYCSDTSLARKTFGWAPQVSPQEGVRLAIAWCREMNRT